MEEQNITQTEATEVETEVETEEKSALPNEATEADKGAELKEDFTHEERSDARRIADAKLVALETALKKITALDPSIKTFDDLMNMENASEFAAKVKKGYTLTDAFIVVNGKKLAERLKAAAVRSALAKQGAKQHLTGAGSFGGESAVDVPSETYSLYKSLYPNITDKEIKAHYRKYGRK